jgi:hypothetical protein
MSSTGPGRSDWDPDDTGSVPLGPEPEPTGTGGAGSGGWGEPPRTEPFAIAALVWALVSIVLPIVGTIVAFVLAARAADAIRRSRGTRTGTNLVNAARAIAGVVIVLWAVGLILFFALREGDSDDSNVALPTQPTTLPTTTLPPETTNTTGAPATTATIAPVTTTQPVAPTTSIVPPPPTEPPTTVAPTQPTEPPTTEAPTTTPTTEPPPTTTSEAPTTTTVKPTQPTTPEQGEEARIQNRLLRTSGNVNQRIGPSDRGLSSDERVSIAYVPGQTLQVRWGINNGQPPLPEGEATCTSPPPPPSTTQPGGTTTTTDDDDETTTTTTTTTTTQPEDDTTTTTQPGGQLTTPQLARREARNILNVIRTEIQQGRLNVAGVQLVGTYPIQGPEEVDVDVVQVFYTNADVIEVWPYQQAFNAPPAQQVQCLNPAFD